MRTLAMLTVCGLLLAGVPMPLNGLLLPISMLFIGEAELSLQRTVTAPPWHLIGWRLLNTLIASATLLTIHGEGWIATSALGLFIVSCSGVVGGAGLARMTGVAAAANLSLPVLVAWLLGRPDFFVTDTKDVLVSVVVFPALALLLQLRSRRLVEAREVLSNTVAELEHTQIDLRASEQRLQEWNQELNTAIEAQTAQLEERNRYLSIINAVSFALAEPMDDFRSLERASRLVARLMGARGAQAVHRMGTGQGAHLFVTVAPEDVHAPRLPESLLRRVAETGTPVISSMPGDEALPDLGEPYAVVPIAARGHVSGAFALTGTGSLGWADQERHLLLLIGREMGVALENMRLYRDAIDRVKREETAGGAARLLDVPNHREHAVHQALELVGTALDAWDIALVTIEDEAAPPAIFSSRRGETADGDWLTPILGTLPGVVQGQQTPVILGSGGETPLSETLEERGIGTLVLVPVVSMRGSSVLPQRDAGAQAPQASFQRVISGMIVVAIEAGVPWRPASSELVSSFAYSLARRLESDELVALQQQRIRELTGLADVARTMQSGADVDRLYAGFAHALTGLLEFDRIYIARIDEFGQVASAPSFARGGVREDREFIAEDATIFGA